MPEQPLPPLTIHKTSTLSIDALREAANAAFAQYMVPVQFTPAAFADFCRNNSIDLTHSLFAQDAEGRIVGMTLLGIRGTRGWCGGLAVIPEVRGQGVGRTLVSGLIEAASALGLKTLHLECLTENTAALRLYEKAGFQPTREVAILSGAFSDVAAQPHSETPGIVIEPCGEIDVFSIATALNAPAPVWQRESVSLLSQGGYQGYAAFAEGQVRAVLLARPVPAQNVLQIGAFAFSNEQAAHALLAHALKEMNLATDSRFACGNEPMEGPVVPLLTSLGFVIKMSQQEMMLTL